jgi:hypothetical protein
MFGACGPFRFLSLDFSWSAQIQGEPVGIFYDRTEVRDGCQTTLFVNLVRT